MSPNVHDPGMRSLGQQLLDCESAHKDTSAENGSAVVRVLETLRGSISTLAGGSGFHALLARALALAKVKVPSLGVLQVDADGSLRGLRQLEPDEAGEAGVVLTAQLLGLLSNFIGEPLMLRLLLDKWPNLLGADQTNTNPGEESPHDPTA